jgi:hypothetical protein
MALRAEDVQKWNDVLRALAPTVGLGVDAVLGLIRLVRRTEGRPEVQPGDELLAKEVIASLTKAQAPWQQVVNTADQQLKD